MPTGYTAGVGEGKVSDFSEFAMSCARAFGACVSMRDDRMDTPIPDEFEPSTYSKERSKETEDELFYLKGLSEEDKAKGAEKEFAESMEYYEKNVKDNEEKISNYRKMLKEVENWTPPTEDHVGLQEFMITQLKESIDFDSCDYTVPIQKTPEEWYQAEMDSANRDLEYHKKEWEKEVERCNGRTKWVKDLRKSLGESAHA